MNSNDHIKAQCEMSTMSSLRCKLFPKHTLKWPGRNRVRITCNTKSRAKHRSLRTCSMSCAKWFEGTAHLLHVTKFKSYLFLLCFIVVVAVAAVFFYERNPLYMKTRSFRPFSKFMSNSYTALVRNWKKEY